MDPIYDLLLHVLLLQDQVVVEGELSFLQDGDKDLLRVVVQQRFLEIVQAEDTVLGVEDLAVDLAPQDGQGVELVVQLMLNLEHHVRVFSVWSS